jgi:hypothetical protein
LKNNTAGVREREDANRTREAGNRDEVEGVVANSLDLYRNGAVGFIDWLGVLRSLVVKAIASDRLSTASRTSLDVATGDVEHATRRSAIIALREVHGVFLESVSDTIVFLAVDHKLFEVLRLR